MSFSSQDVYKKALGRGGEKRVAEFLKARGLKILKTNYVTPFGEADIIAEDKRYIVFAEVKLRKNAVFAEAREFVTVSKQQRIIKTAQLWLLENETDKQPRFDVVEIYAPDGAAGKLTINHIENAYM